MSIDDMTSCLLGAADAMSDAIVLNGVAGPMSQTFSGGVGLRNLCGRGRMSRDKRKGKETDVKEGVKG